MKFYFKNTIILLFRRIDKTVFDVHRFVTAMKIRKVPHWLPLLFMLIMYGFMLFYTWPFIFAPETSIHIYYGLFILCIITVFLFLMAKIYISQLLNYKSPYPVPIKKNNTTYNGERFGTPFSFSKFAQNIDYDNASLFKDYLDTDREDYTKLITGKQVSRKILWLPLTDRKLANFRLFFEFLNHISEENLEGYYGEKLLHLCKYITLNFKSKEMEWTVKQLQKAHSGWKNCNPKRRMDLKIDIENHFR